MTVRELAMRLKEMYENSSNEKTTMIHLFGIMYAEEIKGCGSTPKEILKLANMPESYQTEISKGVRLSKYVPKLRLPRKLTGRQTVFISGARNFWSSWKIDGSLALLQSR